MRARASTCVCVCVREALAGGGRRAAPTLLRVRRSGHTLAFLWNVLALPPWQAVEALESEKAAKGEAARRAAAAAKAAAGYACVCEFLEKVPFCMALR